MIRQGVESLGECLNKPESTKYMSNPIIDKLAGTEVSLEPAHQDKPHDVECPAEEANLHALWDVFNSQICIGNTGSSPKTWRWKPASIQDWLLGEQYLNLKEIIRRRLTHLQSTGSIFSRYFQSTVRRNFCSRVIYCRDAFLVPPGQRHISKVNPFFGTLFPEDVNVTHAQANNGPTRRSRLRHALQLAQANPA